MCRQVFRRLEVRFWLWLRVSRGWDTPGQGTTRVLLVLQRYYVAAVVLLCSQSEDNSANQRKDRKSRPGPSRFLGPSGSHPIRLLALRRPVAATLKLKRDQLRLCVKKTSTSVSAFCRKMTQRCMLLSSTDYFWQVSQGTPLSLWHDLALCMVLLGQHWCASTRSGAIA